MNQFYRALHMPPKRLLRKVMGEKEVYTIAVRPRPTAEGTEPLPALHNKSLAIDNHTLIEGSFNWLSANRHKEYSRHECSIVVSSVQADEYINNLIKELESREKTFQSLSKPTINLDIDQKYPGFFTKESFNDCTEEDICRIKQKVQELGIQKTVLPPYIHKQRETFPRAYEPWCTEEKEIICELMQKTTPPSPAGCSITSSAS